MNGILSIDTDTTDEVVAKLNRASNSISAAKDSLESGFSRLKSAGFYDGVGKMANNCSTIENRFGRLSNRISKNSSEIVEVDLKLAEIADSIVIPEELKTVDSAYKVDVDNTDLDKRDGQAVKTGETLEQTYDDSSNVTKEDKLENIDNSTAHEVELDDTHRKDKKDLEDITNSSDISVEEVTDETVIDKRTLDNINDEGVPMTSTLDDSSIINKEQLRSTSSEAPLKKEELDEEEFSKIDGVDIDIANDEDILKYLG